MVGIRSVAALRSYLLTGIAASALGLSVPGTAHAFDNTPQWNGTSFISSWGITNTATYGQTITATASERVLTSATFFIGNGNAAAPFQAYVYAWDAANQRITGNALYTSGVMTATPGAAFTAYTVNTGVIQLAVGQQYVIFFTTSGLQTGQPNSAFRWGALTNNTSYTGGQFVFQNNGNTFANLATTGWSTIAEDLAMILGLNAGVIGGENHAAAQQSGIQLMNSFLTLLTDPFTDTRTAGFGPTTSRYAPEEPKKQALPKEAAAAFAAYLKAPPMEVNRRWSVWSAGYGAYNRTSGDAVAGTNNTSTRAWGFAVGADYRVDPATILGFAVAGGATSWNVAAAQGTGKSDAIQAGIYGSRQFGMSYVSAALATSYYWMDTERVVAPDTFNASFHAYSFGARLEAGHRFVTAPVDLIPYAAIQGQTLRVAGYNETTNGAGLPLAIGSRTASAVRAELGTRLEKKVLMGNNLPLTLYGRLAWAHDWSTDPQATVALVGIAGTNVTVFGANPASNLALTTLGGEVFLQQNLSFLAKFEGEFGAHTQTYSGTGRFRFTW